MDGKFALELFTLGRFAILRDVRHTPELSKMLANGPETIKPLPSKPRNRGNVICTVAKTLKKADSIKANMSDTRHFPEHGGFGKMVNPDGLR